MEIINFTTKLKDFQNTYEREEKLLPYHFNVIDELHANENAHSRILQKILLYKHKNEYPFLHSFLDTFLTDVKNIKEPLITQNQEYIDLLIEDRKSDFACIIENKIHWATDQSEQIARYIKTVINHGKKNIFVIYLTSDGNKQVSDDSFTDEAKKILGYKDENSAGQFLSLNYREHVLPWLKEEVLNNCAYKDQKMITGIVQYIDHLEGIFNIREDKKKMNEALIDNIRKNFNIMGATVNDYERFVECKNLLNEFQTELDNLKQKMLQENPWNQPPEEKAVWLANDFEKYFKEKFEQIAPFTAIGIYQGNTFVFNNWNYKGYTFGLDITFGRQSGQGIWVSLALRNNSENYYELCSSLFSAIFEKHHWKYQENWRYKKLYNEITSDGEKKEFLEDILKFLQSLKDLQDSAKQ